MFLYDTGSTNLALRIRSLPYCNLAYVLHSLYLQHLI